MRAPVVRARRVLYHAFMKRFLLPLIAFSVLALAACNQATNTTATSSPLSSGSAAASPRATGSVAASASASAGTSANKYIDLQVTVPQPNMNAGVDGMGWTVDVIAKGNGPAMDKVKPAFQASSATATGKNTNFPGLVVLLKSSSGTSGASGANANANLAKLFQIIGLPNTLTSASISSVGTSASSSPAASASTNASASPAGSAATRTTAVDTETAEATWFVQSAMFGKDVDVELTVFIVDGDAPDTVNSTSDLKIVSNEVTVKFHINGGSSGGTTPTGTARPSGSAAPSGSTAPGSASPSPSASSTP